MHTMQLTLKELKLRIKQWNKLEFEHIFQEKWRLEEQMEALRTCIIQEGHNEQLVAEEGYQALLVYWLQALLVYEISRFPGPKSMYKDLVGLFW